MNIYYVYAYIDPTNNIPFYVGYGKNNRMYDHLNEAIKQPCPKPREHKLNKIRKLIREGLSPTIKVIDSGLSKDQACELEIFLISEVGRMDKKEGPLLNLTMGGDGNRDWTLENRNAMSARMVGKISAKDPITQIKLQVDKSDPRWISGELVGQNYGTVNSNCNGKLDGYILAKDRNTGEVFRVKQDDPRWKDGDLVGINKGKKCHENTRLAASNTHKGKPKSDEHNKKNSDAIKQLKWYCNFSTDTVRRCREGEQPEGFVRVSGPHKRKPI